MATKPQPLSRKGPEEAAVQLRFGGGVNSRASEDEIDERECAAGENFDLDLDLREFRPRPPFDLLGTAPNLGSIDGMAGLINAAGTVTMLVQAGTNVYKWDGASFTLVGTVAAGTKMRGPQQHIWTLDDVVLITDIALQQPVMQWNGTALANVAFVNEAAGAFGTFKAAYCFVDAERAHFANVISNGTPTPHLLVGAKREVYTQITVANRPSSALSEADPFFLISPDLRPINGMVTAFGVIALSTRKGSMFKVTGESAKDFAIKALYPNSAATGTEGVVVIGNDIAYGRQGRIESVLSTDKFGDVETDDLSRKIADQVEDIKEWILVYNARRQRLYCFPDEVSRLYAYHLPLRDNEQDLSPWMPWTTTQASGFQPTCAMSLLDPVDGLEYVFFGDASGNLFRLEGTIGNDDAGTAAVQAFRKSQLFPMPLDAQATNFQGWLKYRKMEATTIRVTLDYAGDIVASESIDLTVTAAEGPVYGGNYYYGGNFFYGSAYAGKLVKYPFGIAGKSSDFQITVRVDSGGDFQINEAGLRFQAATR